MREGWVLTGASDIDKTHKGDETEQVKAVVQRVAGNLHR
jgi:hypothetical protein